MQARPFSRAPMTSCFLEGVGDDLALFRALFVHGGARHGLEIWQQVEVLQYPQRQRLRLGGGHVEPEARGLQLGEAFSDARIGHVLEEALGAEVLPVVDQGLVRLRPGEAPLGHERLDQRRADEHEQLLPGADRPPQPPLGVHEGVGDPLRRVRQRAVQVEQDVFVSHGSGLPSARLRRASSLGSFAAIHHLTAMRSYITCALRIHHCEATSLAPCAYITFQLSHPSPFGTTPPA